MSKLRKWMMKEERDTNSTGSADLSSSAIKLFGKTIAVADSASTKAASEEEVEQLEGENLKEGEVVNGEDVTVSKTVVTSTTQEEKKEQCSLKKPEKLIPCPRCESVDTKFCYYNNYNINQPRHFCKSCQRYWTAGGTLRNVLVGAGRRKNKYGVQGAQGKEDGESQHSIVRVDHHEPAQQPMATVYGTVPPMSLPRHSETSTVTSMGCPSAFKPLGPEVSSDSVTKLRQRTSDVTNKSSDCATSCSGETTTTTQTAATVTPATYVLTPRAAPEQAAVWTKPAATPLGFFNGAWPYGYNIGWTSGTQGPPSAATAALCVPHSGNWAGMCVPTFGWNMLQGGWTLPWRPVPAVGVQMQGPGMTSNRKRDAGSDGDARAGKIARVGASAGDEPVAAV